MTPPTQQASAALSQAVDDALAQQSPSPVDVVQIVDAPTGPNDPQAAHVVSLVHTELLNVGGQS